jgi:hypothetical protein
VTAPLSAATVGIGLLQLSNAQGSQEVSFSNYTGIDPGCQMNGNAGEYPVCSAVDIASWALTITFTASGGYVNPSFNSPLAFIGTEHIGPFDGTNPFIGGLSGTWEIPLNGVGGTEPDCPPCDYQITQIEFSGTLSAVDLPLKLGQWSTFDAGVPSTYTIFNAQSAFDSVWTVPSTVYSGISNPSFFSISNDVLVSDQPSSIPSVPEPGGLFLMGAGVAAIISLKRSLNR